MPRSRLNARGERDPADDREINFSVRTSTACWYWMLPVGEMRASLNQTGAAFDFGTVSAFGESPIDGMSHPSL
jgi:hypothetical protein